MNDNYKESIAHILTPNVEGAARRKLIDEALAAIKEASQRKKEALDTRLTDAAGGLYKIELTSTQSRDGRVEYVFAVVEPIEGYPIDLLPVALYANSPSEADKPANK